MTTQNIESFETLYDKYCLDYNEVPQEAFNKALDELISEGYIVCRTHEDNIYIQGKQNLKWSGFHHIDNSLKKNILLYFADNPQVFFVLFNTQKGKLRISANEMKNWSENQDIRVVSFMIVDNDKSLADQSAQGIRSILQDDVKLFILSSNSKTTLDQIKNYIDAYAYDTDYTMPVIVLLPNDKQIKKMLELLEHIERKVTNKNSKLRYGIIIDEADKTYPMIRDKSFTINDKQRSLLDFIINDKALCRIGFVTATDGDLLDNYDECMNAYMFQIEMDENVVKNYRAIHTEDAIINIVETNSNTKSNNSYAKDILTSNIDEFKTPILHNGVNIHRKIIINSNSRGNDMISLAQFATSEGFYAITFNQAGIKVYRPDTSSIETFKMKGMRLNELLFCIYKAMNLNDKPIIIIGRRKVDRGLGFHYAPRKNNATQLFDKQIIAWKGNSNYPGGEIISNEGEGLIWTDMILGHIEDKSTASQKSGRLGGIISQCPQYIGKLYFWTDKQTSENILRHNKMVDTSNTLSGYSAIQSVSHAKDMLPQIHTPREAEKEVTIQKFKSQDEAKQFYDTTLKPILIEKDKIKNSGVQSKQHKGPRTQKPVTEGAYKGFYKSNIRGDPRIYSTEEMYKERRCNIENGAGYAFRACYRDISDITTLEWWILYYPL